KSLRFIVTNLIEVGTRVSRRESSSRFLLPCQGRAACPDSYRGGGVLRVKNPLLASLAVPRGRGTEGVEAITSTDTPPSRACTTAARGACPRRPSCWRRSDRSGSCSTPPSTRNRGGRGG